MAIEDTLGRVANTAILAGMSLEIIKLLYGDKVYEHEKKRRSGAWAKKRSKKK